MMKRTQKELIDLLGREGIFFRTFDFVTDTECAIEDADWNYKDIPHLTYIHKQVDAYPSMISDTEIASINCQNLLGMRLPLTLFNYESGKNRQTYHTCLLFFVLIIETTYEALAPIKTRVRTRYAIGSSRFFLWLGFPLIRWVLKRNYADLMGGDIPMRERRGTLRNWGYSFLMRKPTYSFFDTMKIHERNVDCHVIPPAQLPIWDPVTVRYEELAKAGVVQVGRSDHLGLQLSLNGDVVAVYPRLCPHEGGCLDANTAVTSGEVVCPWHARKFKPIFTFKKGMPVAPMVGPMHIFAPGEEGVRISCKHPLPDANTVEWYRDGNPTRNTVLQPTVLDATDA